MFKSAVKGAARCGYFSGRVRLKVRARAVFAAAYTAGYQTDIFRGIAAVSPSVWFEGWDQYILANTIMAKKTYLSLGDKESKTKNKIMSTVGERIRMQYECLRNDHILEWNVGNHFAQPDIRTAKGFSWLIASE